MFLAPTVTGVVVGGIVFLSGQEVARSGFIGALAGIGSAVAASTVLADSKVRRRRHREATPPWVTRKHKTEMRELYKIAITMTKTTGVQYVVDHIIPLRSDLVCGLHVPWNLRVITQEENLKKSNKLVDDALD